MLEKQSVVNPLNTRKQHLIARSETNRAQLFVEWKKLSLQSHCLLDRTKSFAALGLIVVPFFCRSGIVCAKKTGSNQASDCEQSCESLSLANASERSGIGIVHLEGGQRTASRTSPDWELKRPLGEDLLSIFL